MGAANHLMVERVDEDVFRITWWDWRGRRVEELATRRTYESRCYTLTDPDGLDMAALMGNASHTPDAPSISADTFEHAP